jgi:hypothetical protein
VVVVVVVVVVVPTPAAPVAAVLAPAPATAVAPDDVVDVPAPAVAVVVAAPPAAGPLTYGGGVVSPLEHADAKATIAAAISGATTVPLVPLRSTKFFICSTSSHAPRP